MSKPSVSLVKQWDVTDESTHYIISAGTAVFDDDYYKVYTSDGKTKLFYGEMAWADAERYAYDYSVAKQFG